MTKLVPSELKLAETLHALSVPRLRVLRVVPFSDAAAQGLADTEDEMLTVSDSYLLEVRHLLSHLSLIDLFLILVVDELCSTIVWRILSVIEALDC